MVYYPKVYDEAKVAMAERLDSARLQKERSQHKMQNRSGAVDKKNLFIPQSLIEGINNSPMGQERTDNRVYQNSKHDDSRDTLEISSEYNSLNKSFNLNPNKEINSHSKYVPMIKNFDSNYSHPIGPLPGSTSRGGPPTPVNFHSAKPP
jgi:hypothetical protein